MGLLERAAPMAALDRYLMDAAAGRGCVALLAGEAGVGKTSLARAFAAAHEPRAQVLWGTCDALRNPRPLGPLDDIARAAGGELAAVMAKDAPAHQRFRTFLDALVSPLRPAIVVIEDVHWADEATLDLLVFVAARVAGTHAVLVVTYRDDELSVDHPLRAVLGALAPGEAVHRIRLDRLSPEATAELAAAAPVDPAELYRVTGGNPFFVSQVLAGGDTGAVPETVRDAVLARVWRLSHPARTALEAVAVIPDGADLELVRAVAGTGLAPVEECEQAGLLECAGGGVGFRHELARLAVEQAIPAIRLPARHAAVLAHLAGRPGTDPTRLAHHAELSGDRAAMVRYAPRAAERAARLGAPRQAAVHYENALRHGDLLTARERALLWEECARQYGSIDAHARSAEAGDHAIAAWQEAGDADQAGRVMARRAHALWAAGDVKEADELALAAVAALEARPPGPALASAYAYAAYLKMLSWNHADAVAMGGKAIALAESCGETAAQEVALIAVGSAHWLTDPQLAESTMVRAIEVAENSGHGAPKAAAMLNLGAGAIEVRRYRTADRWLREAMRWCASRGYERQRIWVLAWLARSAFEQGRWAEAATRITEIHDFERTQVPRRAMILTVAARLGIRRGDAGGDDAAGDGLAEARQLAAETGDLRWRWPVAAAAAEAAWLAGHAEDIPDLVRDPYEVATAYAHPWAIGELGFWLWRAGALPAAPDGAAEPYALQIAGDWPAAAAAWEALGCPYEAALAGADSDRPDDLHAALGALQRLGARPAAAMVTARLRALGVRRVPRGPLRRTVANPGGLTGRQLQVLDLLADGMSNAEIAARLHISPRTADHHVAAILTKLGVPTRHHAVRAAREWDAGRS